MISSQHDYMHLLYIMPVQCMLYTAHWSSGAVIQQITIHFGEQVNVSRVGFSFSHLDLRWRLKLSTLASLKVSKTILPKTNSIQEDVYPTRILTSLNFCTSQCNNLTSLQLPPRLFPMPSWIFLLLLRVRRQKANSEKDRVIYHWIYLPASSAAPPTLKSCPCLLLQPLTSNDSPKSAQ